MHVCMYVCMQDAAVLDLEVKMKKGSKGMYVCMMYFFFLSFDCSFFLSTAYMMYFFHRGLGLGLGLIGPLRKPKVLYGSSY